MGREQGAEAGWDVCLCFLSKHYKGLERSGVTEGFLPLMYPDAPPPSDGDTFIKWQENCLFVF